MIFNDHSIFEGTHAFLSASQGAWVNYSEEKLEATYRSRQAAAHGTRLHEHAAEAIRLGTKFQANSKTLNKYVNDAIGFRMTPEQTLYYSVNCYGTADAIKFHKNELRIHDLKTGVTPASFRQLCIYTALFCLEYKANIHDIEVILRIYQNDEVVEYRPEPQEILELMEIIVAADKVINRIKAEG